MDRITRIAALITGLTAALMLVAACGDEPEKTGTGPSVTAEADLLAVTGGTTTLTPDPDTLATLRAAGVTVRPAGAARASDGDIVLPITRGAVRPEDFTGAIRHRDAGIAVVRDGRAVPLTGLVVSTEFDGYLAATSLGRTVGALDQTGLVARHGADSLTARGIVVTLGDQTADLLDRRLGTDVFAGGLPLGTLRIDAEPAPIG